MQSSHRRSATAWLLPFVLIIMAVWLVATVPWPGMPSEAVTDSAFTVLIDRTDSAVYSVLMSGGTVADALALTDVVAGPHDEVVPSPDTPVYPGMTVKVTPAMRVTVDADGLVHEVWLIDGTVHDALAKADVRVAAGDRLQPARNTPLVPDTAIVVTRVTEQFTESIETLPFKTLRWAAPDLPRGESRVIREGVEGIVTHTYRLVYEDGDLVHRSLVSSDVTRQVVDRIVGEGSGTPQQIAQTPDGPVSYKEVRTMEATGYVASAVSTGDWADGLTFTGLKAERGIVAVDPAVIPLGTKLYIEGYGHGLAADIGGAIRGNIIDLFFDSYEEAIQWGRKKVTVYIVD